MRTPEQRSTLAAWDAAVALHRLGVAMVEARSLSVADHARILDTIRPKEAEYRLCSVHRLAYPDSVAHGGRW